MYDATHETQVSYSNDYYLLNVLNVYTYMCTWLFCRGSSTFKSFVDIFNRSASRIDSAYSIIEPSSKRLCPSILQKPYVQSVSY